MPDDLAPAPTEALDLAQRYLDEGRPFPAHDVLEAAWKLAAPAERDLWQGLAQLAVGLTHVQRANPRGAVTLLRRSAERLAVASGSRPYDVDVDGLRVYALTLASRIGADGLSALRPTDLRPRLRLPVAGTQIAASGG